MALAIDASTPAMVSLLTGADITTAAFTSPANVMLIALVGRNGPNGTVDDTGVVSGAGLTWALAGRVSAVGSGQTSPGLGQPGCVEAWWAYSAPALSAVTVTDTRAVPNNTGYDHALKVLVFTGAETAWGGAISGNASASGAPTATLTTTTNGSMVLGVATDWSQSGAGTAGSGQTMLEEFDHGGQITIHFWQQTGLAATSGTSVTTNLTAPATENYNMLAIEVRDGSGASGGPALDSNQTTPAYFPAWRSSFYLGR